MEASKVYYTSFKTSGSENLLQKLRRLCITAGMKNIDFEDKYAAIKIHFGELGNLAFLRPNYAKVVVDLVKEAERMHWIIWIQHMKTDLHHFPPDAM